MSQQPNQPVKSASEAAPATSSGHSSLWRHWRDETPLILLISLLTFLLAQGGALREQELKFLDSWLQLQTPLVARQVRIVEIDDDDYEKIFERRSPLDPRELQKLIFAIARGNPALIAVDLDTAHKDFNEPKDFNDKPLSLPENPPIIWAKGALNPETANCDNGKLKPTGVWGGVRLTGLVVFPNDGDGVVRQYRRACKTVNGDFYTLPRAIIAAWREIQAGRSVSNVQLLPPSGEAGQDFILGADVPFDLKARKEDQGFPFSLKAGDVLAMKEGGANETLKGKIALLGGAYPGDSHRTGLGDKFGVEIIAAAVEAELQAEQRNVLIPRSPEWVMVLLTTAAGYLAALLNFYLSGARWRKLIWLAIPAAAIAGSLIAFHQLGLWANFVPVMIGAQFHKKFNKAWATLLEKLRALRRHTPKQ